MASPGDFYAAVRIGVQMRALQTSMRNMPAGTPDYQQLAAELERLEEAFDRFAAIALERPPPG
jgi:hypothetical protein